MQSQKKKDANEEELRVQSKRKRLELVVNEEEKDLDFTPRGASSVFPRGTPEAKAKGKGRPKKAAYQEEPEVEEDVADKEEPEEEEELPAGTKSKGKGKGRETMPKAKAKAKAKAGYLAVLAGVDGTEAAKKVIGTADADAAEANLASEQRRALWMQYLRSRQGKVVKGRNGKCPAELQSKAIAEPQRYFSMWLKAKKCWGMVKLMEKKTTRASRRQKGGAQWLVYAQLIAHKGMKDGEEWIKALTALASADPDHADEYIKPHPTLSILDETGRNPKMKLFKVTKIVDEEYTDEEQDETARQFEGDMADAPEDAFDEADAAPSAGSKVKRRKALLSPRRTGNICRGGRKEQKSWRRTKH